MIDTLTRDHRVVWSLTLVAVLAYCLLSYGLL
jgi:hypothetical protein